MLSEITASPNPMEEQTYMFQDSWTYQTFIPYTSSPNLGSFSTMGARGEAGIIRKIPVTSDYGYVIQERSYMEYDLIECSKQALSVLDFP